MSELFNFERHCLSPFFFLCVSLPFFLFRASYMNTISTSTLSFLLLRLLPCSPSQIHGFFFNYYCYMHIHLDTVLCSYSKVKGHIPSLHTILLSQEPLRLMVTFRAPLASHVVLCYSQWMTCFSLPPFLSPTVPTKVKFCHSATLWTWR